MVNPQEKFQAVSAGSGPHYHNVNHFKIMGMEITKLCSRFGLDLLLLLYRHDGSSDERFWQRLRVKKVALTRC